ncbi:bifunctional cytochrome P450/NADPH--P450 reductase [Gracilibacillus caseinilyticus]|uniref:Bifunctional cytochrome P450/NADPH--P450 reductase n=1 Tax=Gracilibacillus caseinilyticus TaxID=2932256 RepID=A0ABY4ES34_9BACI|nr:bifunctional cytochrome P450/NADPH--P450 reductase [Gracilibacillus caseinilyticus]UOQ46876.1 bifunctional cytochrome P450/NADPH--P450 reductase [Gracilibacillus caseinilyticus]
MEKTFTIPQPKTYGPIRNLPLLDTDKPILSFMELAEDHGPIYRLQTPASETIIVSGHKLVEEVCDESRFDKSIDGPLDKVRAFGGDGLFTSWTHEPNWEKAHNILMSAFSQPAMKGYHTVMTDIAEQLVQKWARLNPHETIDVPDDMTRLTLDTIGLCAFNYRFNSYYRETPLPFITSMVRALDEAMHQNQRFQLQTKLMHKTQRQFKQDILEMFQLVDGIITDRKANSSQQENDLLARMLHAKDPDTGEKLNDENIRYQIITFLIAGHETTSGLLSFALYFLLKNPDKLKKAYEEVDQVLTEATPTYKQVLKLKYVRMILNEALRLWPTAPAFSLYAKEDTVIGGKYAIQKGERLTVLIPQLHRDVEAWGENAETFQPERFEDRDQIPPHAFKPFGNGQRACIGMQFALHEATLVLGMLLQQFQFIDFQNYQLDVKQTLTLKPDNFKIKVKPRKQAAFNNANKTNSETAAKDFTANQTPTISGLNQRPLLVLYGSDTGTAEGVARELADTASLYGVETEVDALNNRQGALPKEGAVIIVTSSYNGKPPSNAGQFVQWLETAKQGELAGVSYAVFGCGDRNWASTYQDVPRMIDEQLTKKGAVRFSKRGEGDVNGDFEDLLDKWKEKMWSDAMETFHLSLNEKVETVKNTLTLQYVQEMEESPLVRSYEAFDATITENRELQASDSGRSTRHVEIKLPQGVTYQEGDHLGVLPANSSDNVSRVLNRFHLTKNDLVILKTSGRSAVHLPQDRPVSLQSLLTYNVELQEPATRAQIRELADCTTCPPHQKELEALLEEEIYQTAILEKRVSMLDLLETYEACEITFKKCLALLPPLKPRYYSISSSSRVHPKHVSITVAVVEGPARSENGIYRGVASHYLANCKPGDNLKIFIRTPASDFQLPEREATPIIMVGPGTGLAPFRGFLQARSELKKQGIPLGETHLYFGCRNENDFIYQDEIKQYEKNGELMLHTAFSRVPGTQKTYVQDLMTSNAATIIELLDQGAKLYICGDGNNMAPDVEDTLKRCYQSIHEKEDDEAIQWLETLQADGKLAKDVWSGS